MKNKRDFLKKSLGLTLLASLTLNPIAVMASNELPKDNVVSTEREQLSKFNVYGVNRKTGKKIEKEITLKVSVHPDWSWGDEEEYLIKSVNGVFDFSVVEDKDNLYTIEIDGESNFQLSNIKKDENGVNVLKFNSQNGKLRTSNMNGDEVELDSLIFESKVDENEKEDEPLEKLPAFNLFAINKKTGKKLDKDITLKISVHPDWSWGDEEEYLIKSVNGVFDFSVVEDKDNLYTIEIDGESDFELSNIKKDENGVNVLKFNSQNGKLRTSNMNGDEVELDSLIFESKVDETEKNDEVIYKENDSVVIEDIEVVYEDGSTVKDGVNFLTFNKENKDMADYITKDGKLSSVKATVGARMKIGVTNTEEYTLKTDNGYENFVWFKVDESGKAKIYNEITAEISNPLKKIVVVKKSDLLGVKPTDKEIIKKELSVFDTTSNEMVTNDTVKFIVVGAGETREVFSKDGKVELDLYKDTKYTINIVRVMENPYKMSGFKFIVKNDNSIETENGEKIERLNVYQGSYLVRIYAIHGGKHLKKPLEFKIEEIGGETQISQNINNFINFETKLGKSYKITLNKEDTEYYLEKPLEFTMEKHEEDGMYWPLVAKGDNSQGENRKVKAVFLKRYDGVDNHIPGLDGDKSFTPCPNPNEAETDRAQDFCEISKVKVNTLPISVKLPEGVDKSDVKFKLFNSSKQQFEGEFTIGEDGKLPALELFENNSYFLRLVSNEYFMHNKHFEPVGEGKLPFAFKDGAELRELIVLENTNGTKNDGTYEVSIKFVRDNKPVVNEEIQFIGTIHSAKATTDETGRVKVRLMEDVTYVAKPSNENLIIDTFPIVVKDKTEWGVAGAKYVFDHSSCGSAEVIKVKNKLVGRTNGSITCKPGNTTIKGMDFKDLILVTDHLDKDNYPELKGKDFMLLDLVLINNVRQNCERTKLAYGEFEILRKLPADKRVSAVYYMVDGVKEKMDFAQSENIVKITNVNSLGIYPLVIEFESNEIEFPDENIEELEKVPNEAPVVELPIAEIDKVPSESPVVELPIAEIENTIKNVVLVDENSKITVSGLESVLKDLKLSVEKLDANKFEKLNGKEVDVYDIKFAKNGEITKVENGKYAVTIPKTVSKEVVNAYFIDEIGNLTKLNFTQNEKEVIFETTHFSIYALEYKKDIALNTETNKNKTSNNNNTTSNTVNAKNTLAKTALDTNVVNLSALAVLSFAGMYFSKRKNNK